MAARQAQRPWLSRTAGRLRCPASTRTTNDRRWRFVDAAHHRERPQATKRAFETAEFGDFAHTRATKVNPIVVCVCFKDRQGPLRPARRRREGASAKMVCFPILRHTRTHAGANKPQTHTQRGANSTLRSRVSRVPARASAPPRREAREQRGAQ